MRRRPDMTESPNNGSGGGQSSVLCPDGLPVYREILCPHNTVTQSSRFSIYSNKVPDRRQDGSTFQSGFEGSFCSD